MGAKSQDFQGGDLSWYLGMVGWVDGCEMLARGDKLSVDGLID